MADGVVKKLVQNVSFLVGTKIVGCVETMEITVSKTKIGTKCQGSGGINTAEPGNSDYTWSCSGIEKQYTIGETATNYGADDFWTDAEDGTEVTIAYGGTTTDDIVRTMTAYIENCSIKGSVDDKSTYTASGWGNEVERTVVL